MLRVPLLTNIYSSYIKRPNSLQKCCHRRNDAYSFIVMSFHINKKITMKHLLHTVFFLLLTFVIQTTRAQVTKLSNNSNIQFGLALNGKFVMADKAGGLWATDGTAANTKKFTTKVVVNSDSGSAAVIGNKLYFSGKTAAGGTELWVTDGTDAGTTLVKDIKTGTGNSYPQNFSVIGNTIYFSADDGTHGTELWKTNGTTAGTTLLKDVRTGAAGGLDSTEFFINGNLFFFLADDGSHGLEIWRSDGTDAGTKLLRDIVTGINAPVYSTFTALGNKTIFQVAVGDLITGTEQLWSTDGTTATLLKDFGAFTAVPSLGYATFKNKVYLSSTSFLTGATGLWATDGTIAGTAHVKDIDAGGGSTITLFGAAIFANRFMFAGNKADKGYEPFTSDGTDAGTDMLTDINPGEASSSPYILTHYNTQGTFTNALYKGNIFMLADDGTHGMELWISDGTKANTKLVKDIKPGQEGSVENLSFYYYTSAGLFFGADDGTHGMELWKSDGTTGGTGMVKDINTGAGSSTPAFIGIFNNHLYFTADDGDNANGNVDLYMVDASTPALPVTLTSFTAAPVKQDVLLNWETSAEINTSHFTLQRSADGSQFTGIGTVQAAGNSTVKHQYTYLDAGALNTQASVLYYRLQTTDKDGKQYYSAIVPVKINGSGITARVYPNPATDFVVVNYNLQNSSKATLRITDAGGKQVLAKQLSNTGNGQTSVDVKALPAGVYYIQVVTDKGVQTARFIKQ